MVLLEGDGIPAQAEKEIRPLHDTLGVVTREGAIHRSTDGVRRLLGFLDPHLDAGEGLFGESPLSHFPLPLFPEIHQLLKDPLDMPMVGLELFVGFF
jgi:hypothetical protein